MSKTCSILQPHYLPWIGYFDLIKRSDVFVYLDDVQYIKREWKNRNKIRKKPTSKDIKWLSVSVEKDACNKKINQVKIFDSNKWRDDNINSIKEVYRFTPRFNEFSEEIFSIIEDKSIKNLSDLNIKLIKKGCEFLNIKSNFVLSSEFGFKEKREYKLLEICKKLSCNIFLANNKTCEYADKKIFYDENIEIRPQNFNQKIYIQKYKEINLDWLPYLSWIDYIFNKE